MGVWTTAPAAYLCPHGLLMLGPGGTIFILWWIMLGLPFELVGPTGQLQMHRHLVSICSSIPSSIEPSSMPEVVFLIVCNSPLQMSWPCSKPQSFVILSLGLAIKSTLKLFSTPMPPALSGLLDHISPSGWAAEIFLATTHSKPVAFYDTHIWTGPVFLSVGMCWLQNPKREWNEAILSSTLEEGIMALLTSRTLIKLSKWQRPISPPSLSLWSGTHVSHQGLQCSPPLACIGWSVQWLSGHWYNGCRSLI